MASMVLGLVLALTAACSGMEMSFSSAKSSDDALQKAARVAGSQDMHLVQGSDNELSVTENFEPEETANRKLDILMVIDDSESMSDYRDSLASNLSHLFDDESLDNSDWRIAVISTARDNLLLQPFIITSNWENSFATQVKNPSSGHSSDNNVERALYNAALALRGEAGHDWLRKHSIAVVLIVTDEDHKQCDPDAESCSEAAAYSLQNFYEELRQLRKPGITAKIYGILSNEEAKRENFLADVYLEDGTSNSIFAAWKPITDSYRTVLKDISKSVAMSLQNNFVLQEEHNGSSSQVAVNTVDGRQTILSIDEYEITGNVLSIYAGLLDKFSGITSIDVTYTYDSNSKVR